MQKTENFLMDLSFMLYFAVITGYLRITKESIFTEFNNIEINSIMNILQGGFLGFTPVEVDKLLTDYGQAEAFSQIKE